MWDAPIVCHATYAGGEPPVGPETTSDPRDFRLGKDALLWLAERQPVLVCYETT